MRLMITGINGLLSQNIVQEFQEDWEIFGMDLSASVYPRETQIQVAVLDLNDTRQVSQHMREISPDVLIHTAAYTNVDRSEDEPELAFAVNGKVPETLAQLCSDMDIPMVHISTDYVFDGDAGPYREADSCNPRGIYAESKYAGERAVLNSSGKVAVIRPNVMYGHGTQLKSSFVDWLVKELKAGRPVNIVDDQFNNPSYARRLASVIRTIIEKEACGLWHFGSKEVVSRYTFARKIADTFGLPSELINAISTVALKQKAPRPLRSGLICEKLKHELDIPILSIGEELELLKEEMNVS